MLLYFNGFCGGFLITVVVVVVLFWIFCFAVGCGCHSGGCGGERDCGGWFIGKFYFILF